MKITLLKSWAGYSDGAVLDVLPAGENPRLRAVDGARAAQLLRDGIAAEGEALPEPAAPRARPGRKREQREEAPEPSAGNGEGL